MGWHGERDARDCHNYCAPVGGREETTANKRGQRGGEKGAERGVFNGKRRCNENGTRSRRGARKCGTFFLGGYSTSKSSAFINFTGSPIRAAVPRQLNVDTPKRGSREGNECLRRRIVTVTMTSLALFLTAWIEILINKVSSYFACICCIMLCCVAHHCATRVMFALAKISLA